MILFSDALYGMFKEFVRAIYIYLYRIFVFVPRARLIELEIRSYVLTKQLIGVQLNSERSREQSYAAIPLCYNTFLNPR